MSVDESELKRLVAEVRRGKKYRQISEVLLSHIGADELEKRSSFKDAVKATRNKLHQVGTLYFERTIDYSRALEAMIDARQEGDDALRRQALELMQFHTSTRERMGILPELYTQLMDLLPEPKVVLDVACGLNPLAYLWMNLPPSTQYHAFDIFTDLIAFVSQVLKLYGASGTAQVRDIIHEPPAMEADLALVLKSLPCLEQVEKGAGRRLLEALKTRFVAVSYPVQGVGGRAKGMRDNYQEQFEAMLTGLDYDVQRPEFTTELVFLIDKS
jgi:16S rRNA (guanine(1405)-N(7))-methyltransferase